MMARQQQRRESVMQLLLARDYRARTVSNALLRVDGQLKLLIAIRSSRRKLRAMLRVSCSPCFTWVIQIMHAFLVQPFCMRSGICKPCMRRTLEFIGLEA